MSDPQRIGIFGGSFDPVHIGHLIIADRFTEQMRLDYTYLIPAAQSPFKGGNGISGGATDSERCEMLRLAAGDHSKFRVDTFEVERGGVSYTIDTVIEFTRRYPYAALYLLIGGDQAAAFSKWREWEKLLQIAQLCIARRPYSIPADIEKALASQMAHFGREPIWISTPSLEISSTDIRQRAAMGGSIKYQTHPAVEQYIEEHRIYRQIGNG